MQKWAARVAQALSLGLVAAIGFATNPAHAAQAIPAPPADGRLIADYADLLSFLGETTVEGSQQKALREHDTPIIVVTIRRMADYDVAAAGIEEFAKTWFDRWGIGTLNARAGGSNKGILLLVSERDRKARIELGADWGRAWDHQARKIMDESIVPRFRAGSFNDGIDRGVAALSEMAATGPAGRAPSPTWSERLASNDAISGLFQWAGALSAMGPVSFSVVLLVGLGLIGASFAFADRRRPLLVAGVSLVALAAFTYSGMAMLTVIAAGQLARSGGLGAADGSQRRWLDSSSLSNSSSWSSSSGSSGGSGYGGGSSGGGATGSW